MELDADQNKDDLSPYHRTQFVNGQLWKVRWLTSDTLDKRFVTATYGSRQNQLAVWTVMDDNEFHDCFKQEQTLNFQVDIRDLLVINKRRFGIALNDGSASVVDSNSGQLCIKHTIKCNKSHVAAHAICGDEENLCIGYSNGTITLNDCRNETSPKWMVTELSSVQSLSMMTPNIYVSAHASGTIYLWDVRQRSQNGSAPQAAFSCIVNQLCDGVTAVANHPADLHMVGYGTSSGMVELLDTRLSENVTDSNPLPLASGPVWEVGFHPDYPRNFYGAWNGGSLLHFETGAVGFPDSISQSQSNRIEEKIARFSRLGDARVSELLQGQSSVNTFSVSSKGILVGTDSCIITLIEQNYFV